MFMLQLGVVGLANSPNFLPAILVLTAPSVDIDHMLAINFLFALAFHALLALIVVR